MWTILYIQGLFSFDRSSLILLTLNSGKGETLQIDNVWRIHAFEKNQNRIENPVDMTLMVFWTPPLRPLRIIKHTKQKIA